ncbi:TIGR00725 family protein [Actinomadura macrotermitis]|uniref:TIGR00725 family protein n=1 Tax=Actinomadura macrotermitis TaxID=2585200 RepID=A0A7K0BR25_9ACTN|nr:TIGR00725 family protein [Actinomadura macrotermitis]MQY03591.1 hypothetical protein [Actinomadura macrotermitis]
MIQVAVCGPRDASEAERAQAREVGRLLAGRGAVVVCGGYGGVMEAVAAGASGAGGLVVGVLSLSTREGANPHLTVAIPTGIGEARNAAVVNAGDAVIVVGGSWGTLSELALALRSGKRVVQLGGWRIADAEGAPLDGITRAGSPAEAVAATGLFV